MNSKQNTYKIFQFGLDDMPDWFYNADPTIVMHLGYGTIIKRSDDACDMWYEIQTGEYIFRHVETGRMFILPKVVYEDLLAEDLIWRWRDEAYIFNPILIHPYQIAKTLE